MSQKESNFPDDFSQKNPEDFQFAKPFQPGEEAALLKQIKDEGNEAKKARERLIAGFLREVVIQAKTREMKDRKRFIDLVEKANLAVVDAVDSFHGSPSEFSAYVKQRIKQAISHKQ